MTNHHRSLSRRNVVPQVCSNLACTRHSIHLPDQRLDPLRRQCSSHLLLDLTRNRLCLLIRILLHNSPHQTPKIHTPLCSLRLPRSHLLGQLDLQHSHRCTRPSRTHVQYPHIVPRTDHPRMGQLCRRHHHKRLCGQARPSQDGYHWLLRRLVLQPKSRPGHLNAERELGHWADARLCIWREPGTVASDHYFSSDGGTDCCDGADDD